ncbi:XrtA/PEP-CTERM system histidine kinase PrsK [Sphingomonas flavalba]|uniref:XrtA/PEP-CTERM system histidine kinase PrsK n=1 Tax=Sphingomonas flavalba TaxID=2559804 RepID=UPI0039DF5602
MIEAAAIWGHAIAATLFAALAVWQARRGGASYQRSMLAGALALTAAWALATAALGPASVVARVAESARNLGWLGFMFLLLRLGEGDQRKAAVSGLYGVVALVIGAEIVIDLALRGMTGDVDGVVLFVALVLRLMATIGALVLVHNLYTAAAPAARAGIRLAIIGVAVMWAYDLQLYTVAYLAPAWAGEIAALRGVVMLGLAPLFALAARRRDAWKIRLSRTVAFQSLSLAAIGAYLIVMVVVTTALARFGGEQARGAQVAFVFGSTMAALLLLPAAPFRAWFKVKLAKHFFQHRYDYRTEWLRFTETLGRPGADGGSLDQRVVQAIADITESPGGLLLLPDDSGGLASQDRWNWPTLDAPAIGGDAALVTHFERTGRIVELDAVRRGAGADADAMPEWMTACPSAWAAVPLVHYDRLAGVVLLARPAIGRTLDWEDFDLLRVVGRQAASYLAEARAAEALSEARRFDEFNRRFAFIMHDIKNLVSQLTLLARNAERHADNPDFRADMIATLKESATRMNDLLARLSQHNKGRTAEPRPVPLLSAADAVASRKRASHPVTLDGPAELFVFADPLRLEQVLGHLVQNAIDASPPGEPVHVTVRRHGVDAAVEIVDRGAGMSGDFIRTQLFKPFASTKEGGFGIGAYEARTLAAMMGGRIEVESREGEGSRFTLILPQPAGTPVQKVA